MAMHITCHSNDCLPNQFPPPKPTLRDYGNVMLSDYEKGHVMIQSTPSIHPTIEGGTSFPREDPHPLPSYHPAPPTSQPPKTKMDPSLCVTPEKSIPKKKFQANSSQSTDLKNSRVRFDNQITVQHIAIDQSESSISNTETDQSSDIENEIASFSEESSGSDLTLLETTPRTFTFGSIGNDTDDITNIIAQADELNLTTDFETDIHTIETQGKSEKIMSPVLRKIARPKARQKKVQYKPDISDNDVIEVRPQKMAACKTLLMGSGVSENVLARPEFNSTLYMSKEAQELAKKDIDLPTAVSEALKTEKTKTRIQEKASERLNQEHAQFPALVSVDVREDDLIQAVERKMAQVKSTHRGKDPRPEDLVSRPPDIMDYFTPDLQKESPSFSLYDIPPPDDTLTRADPYSAFTVYHKVRAWEGW